MHSDVLAYACMYSCVFRNHRLQPVQATREKQMTMWCDLIRSFVQYTSIKSINLSQIQAAHISAISKSANASSSSASSIPAVSTVFYNRKIKRQLSADAIETVLCRYVDQGYAVWDDAKHTECWVSALTAAQISDAIYSWADEHGHINSVCTIYEIQDSDDKQVFSGLGEPLLLQAIRALEKVGKATVIEGDTLSEYGIKFHPA